ncbi:hypothetical protein NDU88_005379 [Pleurodeles waltl]|uniref:Uncharacterized protein n=1 Tax=Pleurodeles waltl TaxID=8319 RepID=A0AAV7LRZ6_PLEWA|nr:hypothetical protein NDU88_005379 [Pleurodeles waltl]
MALCDGPLLQNADPSCREERTAAVFPDPEEYDAPSYPLPLPGEGGQGKSMRAVHGDKKEDTERSGERREVDEKDTRGTRDGDQGDGGFAETNCRSIGLPQESVVREVPSANSGHACGKA